MNFDTTQHNTILTGNGAIKKGIQQMAYIRRIPLRWFRNPLLYPG
jgi:hypothetical protein